MPKLMLKLIKIQIPDYLVVVYLFEFKTLL